MPSITVKQIAELLLMAPVEDGREFTEVSGFSEAGRTSIVFAEDEAALALATASSAGLILAPERLVPERMTYSTEARVFGVKHPRYAFALIGRWIEGSSEGVVHPTAAIDPGARVGDGTSVGAYTVIEAGAEIGKRCWLGNNVTVHAKVRLGDRCVVQSGAVLGSTGFGYVKGRDGQHVPFPQRGTLWIGDEVEIGANVTIDRGALGETRIGRGTKIDNLVHVAHNCVIGEDVMIAAQVGMAGSCVIEDGAMLGGQAGLGERVTIGRGVMLGGQGGVLPGKRIDGEGQVFWGLRRGGCGSICGIWHACDEDELRGARSVGQVRGTLHGSTLRRRVDGSIIGAWEP